MTSDPVIQTELSQTQREFIAWIELHALDGDGSDPVAFSVSTSETDEDVSIHRHAVESLDAVVCHTMKRIESGQATYSLIESRFEITGAGVPPGRVRHDEVERAVRVWLERWKPVPL